MSQVDPTSFRITDAFDACTATLPGATAIVHADAAISFAALNGEVNKAQALLSDCSAPGGAVALRGHSCPALVCLLLAALRVGRPFVLIDERLPSERRGAMVEAAGASVIVDLCDASASSEAQVVCLHECMLLGVRVRFSRPAPSPRTYPSRAAYVFFTSGSTGRPKGVVGCVEGLDHFIGWQGSWSGVGAGDRVAQLTSPSFDVYLRDVLLPLAHGATLVFCPKATQQSPTLLREWLRTARITHLHTVPTVARLIASAGTGRLSDLRAVFFAGEPLTAALAREWRSFIPHDCRLINLYGPTETSLAKFHHLVTEENVRQGGVMPVGRPLPDCRCFVLDDGLPVVDGVSGEVAIQVPFDPLGYLDAKDGLDRFVTLDGIGPVYLTGDVGVVLDGVLHLKGRVDDEVKIGGMRINPAEIAAHAELLAFVDKAVALPWARDSASAAKQLCLFWTARESALLPDNTTWTIQNHLRQTLQAVTVPKVCVQVAQFPQLPNGKTDRAALLAQIPPSAAAIAPNWDTESERVLHEAWMAVLGDGGRRCLDFVDAGGDSLSAMELASAVEQRSAYTLAVSDIFLHRTLQEIALHGMRTKSDQSSREEVPAGPGATYPLLRSQWGFYRFHVQGHRRAWNNVVRRIRFDAPQNAETIRRLLARMCESHMALRVSLVEGRRPRQRISQTISLPVAATLSGAAEAEEELSRHQFDVFKAPLWRAALCLEGTNVTEVVVAAHHLVLDGMSMDLIEDELRRAPDSVPAGADPVLDYKDVICWDQEVRASEAHARDLRFAVALFQDYCPPGNGPSVVESRGVQRNMDLDPEISASLRSTLRRHGLAPSAGAHALLQLALHRHFEARTVVTGFLHHGREGPGMARILGNFASVRHLRTQWRSSWTVAEFIDHARDQHASALEHRRYEFIDVLDALGIDASGARIPKSALFFNYLPPRRIALDDGVGVPMRCDHDIKHDFMLYCSPFLERFRLRYEYQHAAFSDEEVLRIHDQLVRAILESHR